MKSCALQNQTESFFVQNVTETLVAVHFYCIIFNNTANLSEKGSSLLLHKKILTTELGFLHFPFI